MSGEPAKHILTSKDWFGKVSAAFVLGFVLALGLSGLFKLTTGLGDTFFSTKGQFSMWMMSPIWAAILSFCFFFGSPRRAWAGLTLANIVVWAMLWLLGGIAP